MGRLRTKVENRCTKPVYTSVDYESVQTLKVLRARIDNDCDFLGNNTVFPWVLLTSVDNETTHRYCVTRRLRGTVSFTYRSFAFVGTRVANGRLRVCTYTHPVRIPRSRSKDGGRIPDHGSWASR